MSFEERNAICGILVGFVVWAIMITVLAQQSSAGMFDGPSGIQHWAKTVLWLILIGIGMAIMMTIVFNIAYAMITGEKKTVFLSDERDKIIGLRGIQATLIMLNLGIVAAIIALAFGHSFLSALNILLAGCALSSFSSCVTKLYLYRWGV